MPKISLADVNTALGLVTSEVPILSTAYSILFGIWSRTNPGKTEDDFRSYLNTASQANIDDTTAILRADGYIEQADGSWKKP